MMCSRMSSVYVLWHIIWVNTRPQFFVFVWFSVLWCGFHISELFMSNTFSTHTHKHAYTPCRRSQCEQEILKYMRTFPIHVCSVLANVPCLRVRITGIYKTGRWCRIKIMNIIVVHISFFLFALSSYDPYFIDEGVNHLETRKRNK